MPSLKVSHKGYASLPQPHQNIDIDSYVNDAQWFKKFVLLCLPATLTNFDVHLGTNSTYCSKPMLLNTLKFHYAVLSDLLKKVDPAYDITADQKKAIIYKIIEGINACTVGFHARVDGLLQNYFLPTINGLLSSIRYDIVERTANEHTDEVHTNNRYFMIAEQSGYGVRPKLKTDPYSPEIFIFQIRAHLKQSFHEQYQPFTILLKLKEMVSSSFDQYVGRKEEGYMLETYEPGLNFLKSIFQETELNYDYLITNDETSIVHDINWNLILDKLWNILISEHYFDFNLIGLSFLKSLLPRWLSNTTKADFITVTQSVSRLFKDPSDSTPEDLAQLFSLFTSEKECLAYLNCHRELSRNAKIDILFLMLDKLHAKNIDYIDHAFWQFAAENMTISEDFQQQYAEKYPEKLAGFEEDLLVNPWKLRDLAKSSLPSLIMKLNMLSTDSLNHILAEDNVLNPNGFQYILFNSLNSPDLMSKLIQLISKLNPPTLAKVLCQTGPDGINLLSQTLILSKKHPGAAANIISLIATLPQHDIEQSLLHRGRHNIALVLAIIHCAPAVPLILNLMFTASHETQDNYSQACLLNSKIRHSKRHFFKALLELNLKVNSLAGRPEETKAYEAASLLQTTLITSLHHYFENEKHPDAFSKLQSKWHEGIRVAKEELGPFNDWSTFLKNLALVLLSIPLIGIPLLIHYHQTGCKHLFFQSNTVCLLEKMNDAVNDRSTFEQQCKN